MPDHPIRVLLDQNISKEVLVWLRGERPLWQIWHVGDMGLHGKPDHDIFRWAQEHQAIVITFDEDFADPRSFPLGSHCGVVRLRVWPTTVEATRQAIQQILTAVPEADLDDNLVIVDQGKIRLRRKPSFGKC